MDFNFSIIIPHHNIPQLLKRCLKSIPNKDDVQVIVVDDNSNPQIVDFNNFPGMDRKNTTCILDKKGGGAGYARNVGLSHAKGKWLIFADADDFFTDDFYDIINKYKDDEAQVIFFKADSVDSDSLIKSDRDVKVNQAIDLAIQGKITNKEASLVTPTPWCRMIRRDFVEEKQIKYDEIRNSNDVMFAVKTTCWADNLKVSNEVLYVVTTRKGSIVDNSNNADYFLCKLQVIIRRNKFLDNFNYNKRPYKRPVIASVIRAWKISPNTFWKALKIAAKEKALFSGFYALFNKAF